MTRRGVVAAIAFIPVLIRSLVTPSPLFAARVRLSNRRVNQSGGEHTERSIIATMPYTALEDQAAFHDIAETIRVEMINRLRETGAPINVWRVGAMGGVVACRVDYRSGELKPWKDEHVFTVRTRVSVERQPFHFEE